jgi:2-methylfumaryl-CoA hydratase
VVFGKTVPDISLNAVANLGYAGGRFLAPVYPGDTLSTVSEVIGKKENSNGKTGVVYVRSTGYSDDGTEVLDYVRWVMVKKRDVASPPARCCCAGPARRHRSSSPRQRRPAA